MNSKPRLRSTATIFLIFIILLVPLMLSLSSTQLALAQDAGTVAPGQTDETQYPNATDSSTATVTPTETIIEVPPVFPETYTPQSTVTGTSTETATITLTPSQQCNAGSGSGLRGDYYRWHSSSEAAFTKPVSPEAVGTNQALLISRIDPTVNFNWPNGVSFYTGGPANHFAVRWSGTILFPSAGNYAIRMTSDDGNALDVFNTKISNWQDGASITSTSPTTSILTDCETANVVIEYYANTGGNKAVLAWLRPGSSTYEVIPQIYLIPPSELLSTSTPTSTPTVTLTRTITQTATSTYTITQAAISSSVPDINGIYYVKAVASGTGGTCASWANACALQTALTDATSGSEIWVAAGAYKPTNGTDRNATFQLKSGVALYGGFAGIETKREQRELSANSTILSGDLKGDDAGFTNNTENVYHVVTGASDAILDDFTITAGNANGNDCPRPDCDGGGMFNEFSNPTLANVIFNGNAGTFGGGIYNHYSNPSFTNVTFRNNQAYRDGGGMYNEASDPSLTNVSFSDNLASTSAGGGMFNAGSPSLTNVTFERNAAYFGGGMFNVFSSSALTNVTFTGNTAMIGGGIYNDYSTNVQIINTIFWDNLAPSGTQIYNNNSTLSLRASIVEAGCPAGSTCTNIITSDPRLGQPGNYGGFTQTFPLLAGSSAIDAGNDSACASTDQRGVTRPQGAHCDIGAYEYVDTSAPAITTFTVTPLTSSLAIPITAFTATDDVLVAGYLITSSAAVPALDAPGWTITVPLTYPVASEGAYTLYPWAKDASGHVSAVFAAPRAVVVDTNTPDTHIDTTPANPNSSAEASFTFSSADASASFECRLDGSSFAPCASPQTYTGLTDGPHNFSVRAKDPAGNVDASPASFTWTINLVPLAPTLVSPADALITNLTTPGFSWNPVALGNTYQLEISQDSSFASKAQSFTGTPGTLSYTATALPAGSYFWHVRAVNASGAASPWSITRSLTIDLTPPAAPLLSKPARAAVVIGTPSFTWLASNAAVIYQFQYDNNANFSSPTYTSVELAALGFTPPTIAPGTYSWHVRAKDAAGNWSAWSTARTITIRPAVPLAPVLAAPANAFITNDTTPTFTWNAVAYGNSYRLEISKIASFTIRLRSFTGPAGIRTYTTSALPAGVYYWRVRAVNVKNAAGPWSAARTFSIDITPPAAPVLSQPANGAQLTGTPTFVWLASDTAVAYQFQYDDDTSFASPNYTSAELTTLNHTPPAMLVGIYAWRVRAKDAAGNWSNWSAIRVVTINPPATLQPSVTPTLTPTKTLTPTPRATFDG